MYEFRYTLFKISLYQIFFIFYLYHIFFIFKFIFSLYHIFFISYFLYIQIYIFFISYFLYIIFSLYHIFVIFKLKTSFTSKAHKTAKEFRLLRIGVANIIKKAGVIYKDIIVVYSECSLTQAYNKRIAKGVKKCVIDKKVKYKNYDYVLKNETEKRENMNFIKSKKT